MVGFRQLGVGFYEHGIHRIFRFLRALAGADVL